MWYCLASVALVSDMLITGINLQNSKNKVKNKPNDPINIDQSTQVGLK
jgi:hypothetical protein